MSRLKADRLKRDELDVKVIRFTKAELASIRQDHRSLYLLLGQYANEITMLHSLLVRSMNEWRRHHSPPASRSEPKPERETSEGLSFFLVRMMCGRLWEAKECINKKEHNSILEELFSHVSQDKSGRELCEEAVRARRSFNKASKLNGVIRSKLAFHLDVQVLNAGFDRIPDDISLADFHTGIRGTTFFGIADTAIAFAAEEFGSGMDDVCTSALRTSDRFRDFTDVMLLAFYLYHFGSDRLLSAKTQRIRALPDPRKSRLGFYMAGRRSRRERDGDD